MQQRLLSVLLKSLRPLHWFVLGWVLFVLLGDLVPFQLAFIILALAHLILYALDFAGFVPQRWRWFVPFVQAGLIFFLTMARHDILTLIALSLTWVLVAFISFQRMRIRLLVIGGYVLILCTGTFLLYQTSHRFFAFVYPINYIFMLTLFLAILSLVFYWQQRRAHKQTQALLGELNVAHVQLSAYALRVEELTILAERQRLARELHDTLSQRIVALLMQLDVAKFHLKREQYPEGHTIITQVIERARMMLTETRYVISDLRTASSLHPDDLPELVQEEIERFTKATAISCQANLDALALVPAAFCEHILRMMTEGLSNIARHANARQVWVCAEASGELLKIDVRDDGVGFDPTVAGTIPGHYGLIGLRERARVIGGQFELISAAGKGTTIRMHVPLKAQHPDN